MADKGEIESKPGSPAPESQKPDEAVAKTKKPSDDDEEDDRIDPDTLPEMSVEEVDSFLEAEEPEFFGQMKVMGEDKDLSFQNIVIDDAAAALHNEFEIWRNANDVRKYILKIFPFAPNVSLKFKILKFKTSAWIAGNVVRFRNFLNLLVIDTKKNFLDFLRNRWNRAISWSKKSIKTFEKLSWKTKSIFFFSVLLFVAAVYVVLLIVKHKGFVPKEKELFTSNLANYATSATEYELTHDVEPYYNNPRASLNLILMPKMFVNIKKSEHSGSNPMMAAEFFIEGTSPESVVEIKDREVMFRDLIQRTLEDLTYDEVDSLEGKKYMAEKMIMELNRVIINGRVKNVRIKTIVVKP